MCRAALLVASCSTQAYIIIINTYKHFRLKLSQFACETANPTNCFLKMLPSKLFTYCTFSSDPVNLEIYNQNSSSTYKEYELGMYSHLEA